MHPVDAPFATAAFHGTPPLVAGAAPADAALATALLAAKSEATAAQERVRVAALAWERERTAADALAHRIAEAEHYLLLSSGQQPVVPFAEHAASSFHQAQPSGFGPLLDPTNPMVAQLHVQTTGVQNIMALVSVLHDPMSSSYGRWQDQVLLALRRYALDDHILLDTPVEARDMVWLHLDSVALS
jgi:hypothetical protein